MSHGKEKIIQTQFLRHYKKFYFFFSTSWLSSYSYFAIRFRERKRNTFFFKIFAVASNVAVQIRNILLFFLARKIRGKGCVCGHPNFKQHFLYGEIVFVANKYVSISPIAQASLIRYITVVFFFKVADLIFLSS